MFTFYGVLAILLWGCLALLGVNTTQIPAFELLTLCFFISALLMPITRMIKGEKILTKPTLSLSQWLVGIVGLFGFHFCYFTALKKAPAIEVSLIAYLWPILLAILLSTKTTFLRAIIGGLCGFVGISFVIVGDVGFSFNDDFYAGYLLALCCALIWSSYSWFLSRSNNKVDDIGWLSLIVALLSLFAHLQLETTYWQLTFKQWLGVILLGLGPVGGAFYLWDSALKRGNKKLLASLSFLTPLISSIVLAVFGLNNWSSNILIALGLILLGAAISNSNTLSLSKTFLNKRLVLSKNNYK